MNYNWDWSVIYSMSPDGVHNYLQQFAIGMGWTVALTFCAILTALVLGSLLAFLRMLKIPVVNYVAVTYVEYMRNIPLIVHMFLWFFVLPELVPVDLGMAIKKMPQPWASVVPAFFCLSTYAAARISEVLRAGVESLPRGQFQAGAAIGLNEFQTFRYVVFPQAIRIVVPALTSEMVSAVKYSAIAYTIGVSEITAQSKSMQEYTFHVFEAFAIAAVLYITINWAIIFAMRHVEKVIALPGMVSSKQELGA
ncbi:amino acid ABC transporter permease [Candidimonas nitroreducens]|uniref:Glutamate ABC transporter permease n=1 Tax=Candidimonas nitroreducens TaxID=683354 RepID=A0A225N1D2_9BURK|nr:amino acid ABC transporter permease [Candidimonas nitroreducens]OWT65671.1 glutamate ABC transporter permease [Candidimonas nitroreducens]